MHPGLPGRDLPGGGRWSVKSFRLVGFLFLVIKGGCHGADRSFEQNRESLPVQVGSDPPSPCWPWPSWPDVHSSRPARRSVSRSWWRGIRDRRLDWWYPRSSLLSGRRMEAKGSGSPSGLRITLAITLPPRAELHLAPTFQFVARTYGPVSGDTITVRMRVLVDGDERYNQTGRWRRASSSSSTSSSDRGLHGWDLPMNPGGAWRPPFAGGPARGPRTRRQIQALVRLSVALLLPVVVMGCNATRADPMAGRMGAGSAMIQLRVTNLGFNDATPDGHHHRQPGPPGSGARQDQPELHHPLGCPAGAQGPDQRPGGGGTTPPPRSP